MLNRPAPVDCRMAHWHHLTPFLSCRLTDSASDSQVLASHAQGSQVLASGSQVTASELASDSQVTRRFSCAPFGELLLYTEDGTHKSWQSVKRGRSVTSRTDSGSANLSIASSSSSILGWISGIFFSTCLSCLETSRLRCIRKESTSWWRRKKRLSICLLSPSNVFKRWSAELESQLDRSGRNRLTIYSDVAIKCLFLTRYVIVANGYGKYDIAESYHEKC